MGIESNEKQNLENLSKSILEYGGVFQTDTVFSSFQFAIEYVFQLSMKERIIFAIDEYPYMVASLKSLVSTLQMLIDKYKDTSKMMLILCRSAMLYMENNVLSYKLPLYGRRTSQMKLQPFDFFKTCQYFNHFLERDKALSYRILGGTTQYLLRFDDRLSIEDNIMNTFQNPTSSLFEEQSNLLKQEVREPTVYNAIITAIASGASRLAEISSKVGENTNVCASYHNNLLMLGIVRKETPYGDQTSRETIYSIEDNMFRFCFKFIPKNQSTIAPSAQNSVYERIEPYFNEYMDGVFKRISKQYLWHELLNRQWSIQFASLGWWWGMIPPKENRQR